MHIPTRKGYTFLGWSLSEDNDEIVISNAEAEGFYVSPSSTDDTKYWVEPHTITVSSITQLSEYAEGTVFYAVWQKN